MISESNTLLCTVLERNPHGAFVLEVCFPPVEPAQAASFLVVTANSTLIHLLALHCTRRIAGCLLQDYLPPAIAEVTYRHACACIQQRQSMTYEATVEVGQQSLTLITTLTPAIAADGTITHILGECQDVTRHGRAEKQAQLLQAALGESQRKLATLIDSLPGIVFSCTHDPEWSMSYLSEGCYLLTGYRAEELAGPQRSRSYNSICHPDDLPGMLAAINRAIARQEPYVIEYRIRTRAGQEKWLWEKGRGIYDQQGQILSLEGFITDITELKQANKELQEQKAFLRLVLDNIPLSIFWKDTRSVYLGCNKNLATMLGLGSDQAIIGKTDYDLPGNHNHADEYRTQDRRVIESGQPELGILSHATYGDRPIWTTVNKIPIRNSDGDIVGVLGTLEDITERQQAAAALREAEQKYRSIFENVVEGIFQTTLRGRYLTANPMLARIYGYNSPEELMARLTDIGHQLYVQPNRRQEFIQLLQNNDTVRGFESQIYRKDGSRIWISENARAIRDQQGHLLGYEGTVEDITERKQAEAELRQRDSLLQGVAEATNYLLTETDFEAAIDLVLATLGRAARVDRVYLYENHPHLETAEPAMSMRHEWVQASVRPSIDQPHWQNQSYSAFGMNRWYKALSKGNLISGITREFPIAEQEILKRDGILSTLMVPILMHDCFWGYVGFDDCHTERCWSKNEQSILIAMAASISSALKRQQAEATIRYQAFHDLLTGLPNRMLFNDRLPLALVQAARSGDMVAVMFLDLDRFKIINDTLGHAIGDQLLQAVAQRLAGCLRAGDTISRWGGDEFTLLLPQVACAEDAAKAAQRIIEALKPAFYLEGHELYISSSIGIALYPDDGHDTQTLLKNADAALYRVKEQGRNGFQIYTPAINSRASELLALENSLHHALERNQFILHYQPQVNIVTGEIIRMEALVRWQHPEFGSIPPGVFIPLAEDNGLILSIGDWVLQTACAQTKVWQDAGLPGLRVAVNLSARQFQQPHLLETIAQILAAVQLAPECLELEITETTAMQNIEFTTDLLRDLQALGVHISMDDFGTGYSSLGYLKRFPLHTIKIDRSFVRELTTNPNDAAIVRAVIALARGLNLRVVAEGVETREQLECLRSLNCEEMQGYLFSHPLPTDAATQLLQAYQCKTAFVAS